MERLKLMLVDDHEMVRVGLGYILRSDPSLEVVAEAATPEEAIEKARQYSPDVILMDVRFPEGSGIEACREILSENPNTRVVMLTSYSDDEAIMASIMAGASGYILKQISSTELINAVKRVGRGESLLDPSITGKVLQMMKNAAGSQEDELAVLNEKEKKILALIAEGKTNREIAEELFLSPKTVKNYVSAVLSKLDLSNRAEAAAFAVRKKLRLNDLK